MFPKKSWATLVKSPWGVTLQGAVARGVSECLLKDESYLKSFGRSGGNDNSVVLCQIFIMASLLIPQSMGTWRKRNRRSALPNFHYGQLSDLRGPVFISADRRCTMAGIGIMQALESEHFLLRSGVHCNESWKIRVDTVAGIYPETELKQISNLIPVYIFTKISKVFLYPNI